ncbi:hypothetical protein M427DRAFT_138301 [Gonapodya prolifera JEL478]|uniref:DUF829-domain-containing protein n=1 Tax=Gonapodya prolifera (strain JEL478) TaxID=1344416 RepID=A0A139A3J6_GONPJ|nr:hypothetical protein M427DRAFT_138301 [Gonapodya prolifera JEL478]|eukprot:KXS11351.1 hypothetical protein M427DRAFT_138301 [Gonapodya prolifera JEL478]
MDQPTHPPNSHAHVHHRPDHERFHKLCKFAYVDRHDPKTGEAEDTTNLAVIFGWFGGNIRHVAKYIPLYHRKNYRVILVTTSFETSPDWLKLSLDSDAGVPAFQPVVQYIVKHFGSTLLPTGDGNGASLTSPRHNLAIHVFSNGGTSSLHSFLRALQCEGYRPNTKTLIIDSSPSSGATIDSFARFLLGSANYSYTSLNLFIFRAVACVVFALFTVIRVAGNVLLWAAWVLRLTRGRLKMRAENTIVELGRRALLADELRTAERLFIYSKGDNVVTASEVSTFVSLTRSTLSASHRPAGSVSELVMEKSGHVRHLNDEYERKVQALLDGVDEGK